MPKLEVDQHDSEKRKRMPNFNDYEIRLLMNLAFQHVEILENKKGDGETNKLKQNAWRVIADTFNKNTEFVKRPSETLRQKYDSIKKTVRKKMLKIEEDKARGKTKFVHLEDYEKTLVPILDYMATANDADSSTEEHNGSLPDIPEILKIKIDSLYSDDNSNDNHDSNHIENEQLSNNRLDPLVSMSNRNIERFDLVDEDMLWDLPDSYARPRLQFIKRRQELMNREEKRRETEHNRIMENLRLEKIMLRNRERRLKAKHLKKMELLELQIQVEKSKLPGNT